MFIDLEGFKPVNDSFGHAAGDVVLMEAALRLLREARDSDTVARVGGDEFLLLMEDAGSLADCVTLARRLVVALSRPFAIAGKEIQISCSVGVVPVVGSVVTSPTVKIPNCINRSLVVKNSTIVSNAGRPRCIPGGRGTPASGPT